MYLPRLSTKLILVYLLLNVSLAVGYVTVIARWQRRIVFEEVEAQLLSTAIVLREQVRGIWQEAGAAGLQALIEHFASQVEMRITVVDSRGRVLADSWEEARVMEDHADRPELQAAWQGSIGRAARPSRTLRQPMLYLAVPVEGEPGQDLALRLALPLQRIDEKVRGFQKYLWLLAATVGLLALGLMAWGARRVMRPLTELTLAAEAVAGGNYQRAIPHQGADELATLGRSVEHMRRELLDRMSELQENSQRLETVLSSMVEGVLAVNTDQRVLFANQASRELLGMEAPEVVQRPLVEVTRHRVVRDVAVEAIRTGSTVERDFETVRVPRRRLALRATPLPGRPSPGAVIVLYDLTELRRLEALRREFVANVSHELKTPLSAIKAYAETLRLGALDDPRHNRHFVERIEEQADRLHQLILDLLHLARVESGRQAYDIRQVAFDSVIAACETLYREQAAAKELDLEFQLPETPIWVQADEDGLRTILDNLVVNALQYTPPGGRVTVRVRGEAGTAVLEVEDTGVGIAPLDQQRVFERFYRVDKARSREVGGTGLGLAIVKHLTQAFGGQVGLTSQLGQGSQFRIQLPRTRVTNTAGQ